MRKHRDEIIRFANSEAGTRVWQKGKGTLWTKTSFPLWNENHTYILDDKYAELRKSSIDTCRPIQFLSVYDGWTVPKGGLKFAGRLEDYRLKPEGPVYYYQWKKLCGEDRIRITNYISDEHAEKQNYEERGWVKIERSKKIWEDIVW